MRILVLGGTAFLSAEVVRSALAAGHHVTALARGSVSPPPDGAMWLREDRACGPAAYGTAREMTPDGGWDGVVDVSRHPRQAREALEALAGSARHWTFISSISVYADPSVAGAGEDTDVLPPLAPESEPGPETYGEAKVAIERWTAALAGDKAHICRPGLISGPGDASDRYGYWPARFARTADPVLVPDIPSEATQVIDVRDLAAWIVKAAETGVTGALDAAGETVPFAAYLAEARRLAGGTAGVVTAPADWLASHGVNYWSGPESLPLWLPPGQVGLATRSSAAARAAGLRTRPWQDTLADTLTDERRRGLGRDRRAGVGPDTERRLVRERQAEFPPS